MFRSLTIVAALLLSACTRQNVDLEGRTCGDACLASYVCNPLTTTCSPAIDVGCGRAGATCPDSTNTGDACDAIGAYLPCHGTALDTCENGGCRTCSTSYTWTDCACVSGTSCICSPTNGGIEICDGLDNNCDGTVDNGVDGAQGCVHAWIDADGDGYGAQGTTPICRLGAAGLREQRRRRQ